MLNFYGNMFSPFMIRNKFTDVFIFSVFLDPTSSVTYKGKQDSEKIQRVKIRLNLKANYIGLTISSNDLYFNFPKSH